MAWFQGDEVDGAAEDGDAVDQDGNVYDMDDLMRIADYIGQDDLGRPVFKLKAKYKAGNFKKTANLAAAIWKLFG